MKELKELPINRKVIKLLENLGLSELFPPQQAAFDTGVLEGKNLVLAVPTSSGKTLVAELCMIRAILDGRGKGLYLVPLRSLAHEKYAEFKKYEQIGITTAMSVGDYDSSGTKLRDADIVVVTTEKADSLIRHKAEWLDDIGVVVADEIHLVNDPSRGPTLEMVLAKMIQSIPEIQVVALSATISNAKDIAAWLDASLIRSDWRPVPLDEGVYIDGSIAFKNGPSKDIKRTRRDDLTNIVCDILDENGQVLVFVSSRRSTVSVAKKIASSVRPYLQRNTIDQLSKYAGRINKGVNIPEASKTLARVMAMGAAFHHAGLANSERSIVEDCFRNNLLKVIIATPTLAAGVNLPARRVVIRDYRRFEQGRGNYPIPILEYKQMAGRAGRPKYDSYGEAVLIAKTEEEYDSLTDYYILSEPETISSKLASPTALRSHLLASIANGMTQNRKGVDALIGGTFFSYQYDTDAIDDHIESALTFLENGELIQSDEKRRFNATTLGKRVSQLYVDPQTAIMFRDVFLERDELSIDGVLHLLCHSPDQPVSYVTRSELEHYAILLDGRSEEFLISPPDSWDDPEGFSEFLSEIKTASMLYDWISEQSERNITEQYNVGVGDIHRYVQSAIWLLYSASEIARVVGASNHVPKLRRLGSRMKHGVKGELLELVGLRGIGRVRGRMLHNHDLRTLADLHQVDSIKLARIPTIGTTLAKSIKRQLGIEEDEWVDVAGEDASDNEVSLGPVQTLLDEFDD
ncbi:MAG: DEAD/DEAH box helicase [Candidatus Thorarchaeota archaeon]|nr:MAG: DEAD/DEAH box helicase [Candidatus Thorarchaeota archaeon]